MIGYLILENWQTIDVTSRGKKRLSMFGEGKKWNEIIWSERPFVGEEFL